MLRALLQAVDAVVEGFRADPDRLRLPRRLVAETPALAAPSSRAGLDWEAAIAEALRRRFGDRPEARLRADLIAGAVAGPVRVAIRTWEDSDYHVDPRPLARQGLDMLGRGRVINSDGRRLRTVPFGVAFQGVHRNAAGMHPAALCGSVSWPLLDHHATESAASPGAKVPWRRVRSALSGRSRPGCRGQRT